MEYGSIFGHGAYLGPDFTADYLHRAAVAVRKREGRTATLAAFRRNRYDSSRHVLRYTGGEVAAFTQFLGHYTRLFRSSKTGLRPDAITDPKQLKELTAYFAWSAWAASARRPGHSYSYTNNWPPEPLVGNAPTANVVLWSLLSLIALLGGIGLLFAAFGRWRILGWQGREQQTLSFRTPGDVALTPAQRATAWFFFVMAALFLVQTFVDAASQHYRADISSFFGINLERAARGRPLVVSGVAAQLVATFACTAAAPGAGRRRSAPPIVRTANPIPLSSSAIPTTRPKIESRSAM
jgi:nitric oxide reductase subunit B